MQSSRYDWNSTPGVLRLARIVLVLGVLFAGGVGVYTGIARVNATSDIADRLESLDSDATTLYRSLADADATVAAGYLSGGVEPAGLRTRYGDDMVAATASLARAGAQTGTELVTTARIADITRQLPTYTGLVERARANNRQGFPVGVSYLRRASELMRNSILPEAAEVQQRQAMRLDDAYPHAESVPFVALVLGGVSLAGLIWAQRFLYRRTRRVLNIGLLAASGAVIAGLVWWIVVGKASADALAGASGHSRSVSEALAPAQTAASQARALESLELIDRNGDVVEPQFDAQMQRLDRNDGAGGALGAAAHFASDQKGAALVKEAIEQALRYAGAHNEVRRLDGEGEYIKAVNAAVSTDQATAATTFDQLVRALNSAVDYEHGAFRQDIVRAGGWLTGLPIVTGTLALVSAIGVILGFRRRLEEYR